MNRYFYDGSFEGFLCALSQALKNPGNCCITSHANAQLNLGDNISEIVTSKILADKVYRRIEMRWGNFALETIYLGFLYPGTEALLLVYLQLLIQTDTSPLNLLSHPELIELQKKIKSVNYEIHRLKGFIRFQEIRDNYLYAQYGPDYDITPMLMNHFIARLQGHNIVIQDIKRGYAGVFESGSLYYTSISSQLNKELASYSDSFQDLWHAYFNHMGILERENQKLQKQLVPLKYRGNITEFQ